MIAMQYKISLPDDYDMDAIRRRVDNNGFKTDGFPDLSFKAYLIGEIRNGSDQNEYAPFYLWDSNQGMNQFIFGGFYDNILTSFGWQKIQVGIPYQCYMGKRFGGSKYAVEAEHDILPAGKMRRIAFTHTSENCTGRVLLYHPDIWKCTEIYFYETRPDIPDSQKIYQLLHMSR